MLKLVSFHIQAHLKAFLQILEYISQICLGPLARESPCIFLRPFHSLRFNPSYSCVLQITCQKNQLNFPHAYIINHLTPNDPYMGRTAPLTSKRCILYTYLTNIGTEYFKHALYSPFFLFKMQFVS